MFYHKYYARSVQVIPTHEQKKRGNRICEIYLAKQYSDAVVPERAETLAGMVSYSWAMQYYQI